MADRFLVRLQYILSQKKGTTIKCQSVCALHVSRTNQTIHVTLGGYVTEVPLECGVKFGTVWADGGAITKNFMFLASNFWTVSLKTFFFSYSLSLDNLNFVWICFFFRHCSCNLWAIEKKFGTEHLWTKQGKIIQLQTGTAVMTVIFTCVESL